MEEEIKPKITNPEINTQPQGIPFHSKQFFQKFDNFQANALGFPSKEEKEEWFIGYAEFERELEDLMRRYKVVQVVATIFSKLRI